MNLSEIINTPSRRLAAGALIGGIGAVANAPESQADLYCHGVLKGPNYAEARYQVYQTRKFSLVDIEGQNEPRLLYFDGLEKATLYVGKDKPIPVPTPVFPDNSPKMIMAGHLRSALPGFQIRKDWTCESIIPPAELKASLSKIEKPSKVIVTLTPSPTPTQGVAD